MCGAGACVFYQPGFPFVHLKFHTIKTDIVMDFFFYQTLLCTISGTKIINTYYTKKRIP